MTPVEIVWLVGVAATVGGAIIRGHFPRLWPYVAPVLGAATQPPPPAAPQQAHALALYNRGEQRPGFDEDELHYQLAQYVARQEKTERLHAMLARANATALAKTGQGIPPSAN